MKSVSDCILKFSQQKFFFFFTDLQLTLSLIYETALIYDTALICETVLICETALICQTAIYETALVCESAITCETVLIRDTVLIHETVSCFLSLSQRKPCSAVWFRHHVDQEYGIILFVCHPIPALNFMIL